MKVLLLGGAGHVGSFITPYLREHHALRVLDLRPPRHAGVEYVEGSVADPEALRRAFDGIDAFIWRAAVMRTLNWMKASEWNEELERDIACRLGDADCPTHRYGESKIDTLAIPEAG